MAHVTMRKLLLASVLFGAPLAHAAEYPTPKSGDYVLKEFRFATGETLPEVRVHYRTIGEPRRNSAGIVRNAVLILHGTTGSGENFLNESFAGELFGRGQPLDASEYYIILPDNIGHGKSSKPSDGLRARFPRYGYRDMIAVQHRLLTDRLGVHHLRLVIGTSMGGMHTWLWGGAYPDFMDALMPLASLPAPMSGRNRMWRKTIADAIRSDPAWAGGEYREQPPSLRTAIQVMTLMSNNPVNWQKLAPTAAMAEEVFDKAVHARLARADANDVLYAIEASRDYDPRSGLPKITAPLVAINFADDLINPPELEMLEKGVARVKDGAAITVAAGPNTVGHGSHTKAVLWKQHLVELLKATDRK